MHFLLVGSYGTGNVGDTALREYFVRAIPQVTWSVTSARAEYPEDVPHVPFGIRSLFRPWWRTFYALWKADGVVFGGGSLFTDIESLRACMLWWWYTCIARCFRKPIYFAFQGVGPFRTELGEWLAKNAYRNAAFIAVRDSVSAARVQEWGVSTKIVQTFDPIFSVFDAAKQVDSSKKVIVLLPRANSDENFLQRAKERVQALAWDEVRIVMMEATSFHERQTVRELENELRPLTQAPLQSIETQTLSELEDAILPASLVLSQRYHGALAAMALKKQVEVVIQAQGDKLSAFQELQLAGVSPEELASRIALGLRELTSAMGILE